MKDRFHIDSHKLLWHLDRLADWQKGRLIAPIYIEISPTSACNHRCVFCGIDFARTGGNFLQTNILCERLKEMATLGLRSIMFAGEGEPLLHKDLSVFVQTAKASGLDISITTNGSLFSDKLVEEILPHLTWIRFSIDAGSPDVYSKVHRVSPQEFSKVISNIKDAARFKKENQLTVTIGVQYLLIDENLKDLKDAFELFADIDIDYLSLKPFSLHPQMKAKMDVSFDSSVISQLQTLIDSASESIKDKVIFRAQSLEKYLSHEISFSHCYALPFWGYIASDGGFYTCSVKLHKDDFCAGNIYQENMASIFWGDKRASSIDYASRLLDVKKDCRVNCRMARVNEFLESLATPPEHVNFI